MIKIYAAAIALLLLHFTNAGSQPLSWSFEDVECGWNESSIAIKYFHYSEMQRQWAWELMGTQSLLGNEKILDFGCGDGKVTAEISRLVPDGSITGVDISSEMLKLANLKFPVYAYPNLDFVKTESLTLDDITAKKCYDLICCFSVFHQVADPKAVLKNLKKLLKPNGKLILLIPAGKNPVLFEAATELLNRYQLEVPWQKPSSKMNAHMRTQEDCKAVLTQAGYHIITLKMIDTDNPFYDKNELINWMIGTVAPNWEVPNSLCPAFFTELVERMCELDPKMIDNEGRVHFKLSRIHVVASK